MTNLGLTTSNYTSAFVLWNWAYAYFFTSTRFLKARSGIDHNENPRHDLTKYGERAVAEGKMTRKRLLQLQRAQSAHENSVETFAFFASTSRFWPFLALMTHFLFSSSFPYCFAIHRRRSPLVVDIV